jgi:hypothetical protein
MLVQQLNFDRITRPAAGQNLTFFVTRVSVLRQLFETENCFTMTPVSIHFDCNFSSAGRGQADVRP